MVDIGAILGGFGDSALLIVYFILFLVVAMGIYFFMSHNIKVRITDIAEGNFFIVFDRGKISKDSKGNRYFSLLFARRKISTPPSSCIKIGKRGKKYIDYYRTEDDAYLPVKDTFDFQKYKKDNADLIKAHLEQVEKYDQSVPALEGVYCPLSSEERVVFVSELEAADSYKKKNIMDYLVQFAPYIAIVMILVIFMAFFGDVVGPIQEQGKQNAEILDKTSAVLERAIEIQDGRIELLKSEVEARPEEPPN